MDNSNVDASVVDGDDTGADVTSDTVESASDSRNDQTDSLTDESTETEEDDDAKLESGDESAEDSLTGAESDSDSDTDTETDTDTGTDTEIDVSSDSETESATDSDGDSEQNPEENSDVTLDGGDGAGTGNDIDDTSNRIPASCHLAAEILTSVGCEFFVADLENSEKGDPLTYAVVVSNPQTSASANVRVEDMRGDGGTLRTVPGTDISLAPGSLHIFELTCESGCPERTQHIDGTGMLAFGAFRVVSDVPILAYQWNTYGTGLETTDATLLLPTTSLDTVYIGASWKYGPEDNRSELTIVATQDNTQITFIPSVDTEAGGGVPAFSRGVETSPIVLNAFDMIQVRPAEDQMDLTGTRVTATGPIAVFGGHSCAFVPTDDYGWCDHLEEQLLPLSAWGSEAVLARYGPRYARSNETDQVIWRIVAGADDMTVYFDPPVVGIGEYYQFSTSGELLQFESPDDHYVYGELNTPPSDDQKGAPFLAYQLMSGRCYVDGDDTCDYEWGDPMMLLTAPAGQYLDRYVFNTDSKFDFASDQVIVVRPIGATVEIGCLGVLSDDDFVQVGSSDFEVGRFHLEYDGVNVESCEDGPHRLISDMPVGLSVVGTDFTKAYGYLGGVGVRTINPVIIV